MKSALALLLALAATASLSAQVFLTNFGSDSFDSGGFSPLTQTDSTGTFEGDLQYADVYGEFKPSSVDIPGFTSALSLTATVFDNPGTGFKIRFFNASGVYFYEGVWSDFATGIESTVVLNAMSGQTGAFDFAQMLGLSFDFDGGSSDRLHVTFSGVSAISAVPEPSTYAALVGLISLGGALLRRRRRA